MIPTATQCVALAAERLTNSSFDEPFTQARLLAYFNVAYRELFGKLQNHGVPAAEKTAYFNLPAYTNTFSPAKAGITDFGELKPGGFAERSIASTHTITTVEPTSGEITLTVGSAHSLSANSRVIVYNASADAGANGEWYIAVPSSTKVTLNGSTVTVSGSTACTGTLSTSTERFVPLIEGELPEADEAAVMAREHLGIFQWTGELFKLPGATTARQLRIQYRRSAADLTLTESTGIDDSKNFLGIRAAELAARDYDRTNHAQQLKGEADAALLDIINLMAKAKQRVVTRRPPFRHTMGNRVHLM